MSIYDINTKKTGSNRGLAYIFAILIFMLLITYKDSTSRLLYDAIYGNDTKHDIVTLYDGVRSNFTIIIPKIGGQTKVIYDIRNIGKKEYSISFYVDIKNCTLVTDTDILEANPGSSNYVFFTLTNNGNVNVGMVEKINIKVLSSSS